MVGRHTFNVDASDYARNASSASVSYEVSFAVEAVADGARAPRGTAGVTLRLTDAHGVNQSSPAIGVTGHHLTSADGRTRIVLEQPVAFDAELEGYRFTYDRDDLAAGTYTLAITASGDGVVHSVPIRVR
jgi:hypothetical protein